MDLEEFSCNKLDVSQEEILLRSDWRIDMSEGEFTGNKNIISIEDEMRKRGKGNISNTIYVDEEEKRTKDGSLGNT